MLGATLRCTSIPSSGSRNTLSLFMLHKLAQTSLWNTRFLLEYNSPLLVVSEIHHSYLDSLEEIDGTLEDGSEKNIKK